MAGKHGFLGEILLTKDFSPLRMEKSSAFDLPPLLLLNVYVTDCTSCLQLDLMGKFETSQAQRLRPYSQIFPALSLETRLEGKIG